MEKTNFKCFVCGKIFECYKGSLAQKTELCPMCLINGAVSVVNLQGDTVQTPDDVITQEKQEEMVRRIEKVLKEER